MELIVADNHELRRQLGLSIVDMVILCYIKFRCRQRPYMAPHHEIAEYLNITEDELSTSLKTLQSKLLISDIRDGLAMSIIAHEIDNYIQNDFFAKRSRLPKEKKIKNDELYLLIDKSLGTLKIGRSKNSKARVSTIQLSTANEIELLFAIPNFGNLERTLHEKFAHLRLASEWFSYDDSIVNEFLYLNESVAWKAEL